MGTQTKALLQDTLLTLWSVTIRRQQVGTHTMHFLRRTSTHQTLPQTLLETEPLLKYEHRNSLLQSQVLIAEWEDFPGRDELRDVELVELPFTKSSIYLLILLFGSLRAAFSVEQCGPVTRRRRREDAESDCAPRELLREYRPLIQ